MESVPAGASVTGYHSVESSPRSRAGDSWDDPASARLRVMCSYGGQILPRLADKSLCYIGGETRMVSIDRYASLAELSAKLSRDIIGGAPFSLKYQLPNEDLDSLISVSTDEDLENMIDELDRFSASPACSSSGGGSTRSPRLRVFLFPSKPDSAPIGPPIDGSKSDTWFVDALNNAMGGMGVEDIPDSLSSTMRIPPSTRSAAATATTTADSWNLSGSSSPVLTPPASSDAMARRANPSPIHHCSIRLLPSDPPPPLHLSPISHPSPFPQWTVSPIPVLTTTSPARTNRRTPPPVKVPTTTSLRPILSRSPLLRLSSGPPTTTIPIAADSESHSSLRSLLKTMPSPVIQHQAAPWMQNSDPNIPSDQVVYVIIPTIQPEQLQQQQQQQRQQQQSNLHLHQQQLQYIPANPHYLHQPAPVSVLPVPSYYPIAGHSLQQVPQARPLNPQIPVFYVPVHHTSSYNLAPVQPNLNDPSSSASSAKPEAPAGSHRTASTAPSALQPQLIHVAANQAPRPYGGAGFHVTQQHPHLSQPPATMANYPYEITTTPGYPQVHHSQAISQPALLRQHQRVGSASVVPEGAAAPGDANASRAP